MTGEDQLRSRKSLEDLGHARGVRVGVDEHKGSVSGGLVLVIGDALHAFHPAQEVEEMIDVRLGRVQHRHHGKAMRPRRPSPGW